MALTDKYVTSSGAGMHSGASEANALSWAEALAEINAGAAAGTRYNMKGAIPGGATDAITGSGTISAPIILRGYLTTPGDGYQGRTDSHGDLVTTHMPAVTYAAGTRLNITGSWIVLETLNILGAFAGSLLNAPTVVVACALLNTANSGSLLAGGLAFFSDLTASGTSSNCFTGGGTAYGCKFSFTNSGFNFANGGATAVHCVFCDGSYGVNVAHASATATLMQCTGYALTGALARCGATSVAGRVVVVDCHATDGGRLVEGSSGHVLRLRNRTRDNASADSGTGDWPDWFGVTTDTGGPETDYVDAGAGDLRLIAAAPGSGAGAFGLNIGALPTEASAGSRYRRSNWQGGFLG